LEIRSSILVCAKSARDVRIEETRNTGQTPKERDRTGARWPCSTPWASLSRANPRRKYDLLAAASAMMSSYFGIKEIATEWLKSKGLEE
jgi:hypothetical protein